MKYSKHFLEKNLKLNNESKFNNKMEVVEELLKDELERINKDSTESQDDSK